MMACLPRFAQVSDAFPVAHGVKQGCPLAPTLFTVFLSAVLELINHHLAEGVYIRTRLGKVFNLARLKAKTKVRILLVRELLYADDTAFVAHNHEDLQRMLTSSIV